MSPTEQFLTRKAMLVYITICAWKGQKKDVKASDQTQYLNNARPGAGKYVKNLIDQHHLAEINKLGKEAREQHYLLTLPWDDSGYRILPVTTYDQYRESVDRIFERRIEARNRLVAKYEEHIEEAKTLLGRMFKPEDYPSASDLTRKITARYQISPIQDPSHFLVEMQEEENARIRTEMESRINNQIRDSVKELYDRLRKVISHAHERLQPTADGKPKEFRNTLVTNIRDLIDIVPKLNITGDPNLAKICHQLRTSLAGVYPDQLRANHKQFSPHVHDRVTRDLHDLTTQFGGYFR